MENTEVKMSDTLKSADTEETLDIYFYRPIGYMWALLARKIHVTPNMITIASIFIGSAAGVLFYFPDLELNIAGMLLLILANSFDSADGQLARMTNNKTRLGRFLDGFAGDVWFAVIYVSLALKCLHYGGWNGSIWVLASFAGLSHVLQASIADYYRNIHLYFVEGKNKAELEDAGKLNTEYEQLSWGKNFLKKLMMFFYRNHTKQQELLTPNFQKLMFQVNLVFQDQRPPLSFIQKFREGSKPLMKYTNILQFNTRILILFISLIINKPYYYFWFDLIVLNIVLIYTIYKHEKLSKKLLLSNELSY